MDIIDAKRFVNVKMVVHVTVWLVSAAAILDLLDYNVSKLAQKNAMVLAAERNVGVRTKDIVTQ